MKFIEMASFLKNKDDSISRENTNPTSDDYQTMEQFLCYIEQRAFHYIRTSVGNIEDTHDIVQESMYKLVQKYAVKSPAEWKPLLYRIMSSKVTDFHRRRAIREKFIFQTPARVPEEEDYLQSQALDAIARDSEAPLPSLERELRVDKLIQSIRELSLRQQQAFMLRCWEGMSTKDTAIAMGCSEGSVKTHYSRAMIHLREQLEDHYYE
jgi:RNA polymerase sigma-70 factor (ECF subfamily)